MRQKTGNTEITNSGICQQVREYQKTHKLTNAQMANKLGCHINTLNHIRAGLAPGKEMLTKITRTLQSSPKE